MAYHTGVLLRHGFVELARTERRHGALTRWYRCATTPVIDAAGWEGLPAPLRRALAVGTLDQLADDARRAAVDGGFDHRDAHLSRVPLELDRQGVRDVALLLDEAETAFARIAAAATERATTERVAYEIVVLGFDPSD